jgi:transglycosylase-like protein
LKAPLIAVISVGIAAAAPAVAISANEPVKALSQLRQDAKRQTNTGTGSAGTVQTPIGPVTIQNKTTETDRHKRLVRRFLKLRNRTNRLIAKREGRKPRIVHTAAQARWSDRGLRRAIRVLRKRIRRLRASLGPAISPALRAALERIAACESHGNPRAIGGGGSFRGKYQFTYGTWAAVGGKGDPAGAPEAEQDRRAAILITRGGSSQWPVCG